LTLEVRCLRLEIAPLAKQSAEVKDELAKQTAAIEGIMDQCDMSRASSMGSRDLFIFKESQSDPPMVAKDDPRVKGLVQVLHQLRSQNSQNFRTDDEKLCRDKCIIPFFQAVAQVYRVSTTEPNSPGNQLKVFIGRKWFHGYTDLFVGGEKELINEREKLILMIEMKPMTGDLKLKGTGFHNEKYAYQAQIVLQGAAIQSCCTDITPFSCILTNLRHMYVLQVTSYNSIQITAQTFKCVSDESKFVRAVLKAADTNKQIQKQFDANKQSIMCVTSLGYDSHISSLALGGIPQVQASAQGTGTMGAAFHERSNVHDAVDGFNVVEANEALSIGDGFSTLEDDSVNGKDFDSINPAVVGESCPWNFAACLQPDEHRRTSFKTSYTKAWVHLLQQQPLADCSSQLNTSKGTRSSLP
jgi:hypothetical protein